MKEKLKIKSLAIILIFVFIFQYVSMIVPLLESIAETYVEPEWGYTETDESDKITDLYLKNKDNVSGEIEIPSEINGKSVTGLKFQAFGRCRKITKITIPEGITSIPSYCFYECTELNSVIISESVTSIR